MNLEQFDQALELALRAVTENPNDAFALGTAGVMSLFCGELQAAADYQLRALSLSPNEYFAQAQLACVSHIRLCEGRPEEAIEWALRSLAASPHWPPSYWLLAAANAHLGRIEEARRYVGELLKINPSLTVSKLRVSLRARDPSRVEVVIQGLRLGGLPEN